MIPYAGTRTLYYRPIKDTEVNFNVTEILVLSLTNTLPPKAVVYFDNYFTTINLLAHLRKEYEIYALGSLRANRLKGATMAFPASKPIRGEFVEKVDNAKMLTVLHWQDNKNVLFGSNYCGAQPIGYIKRHSKTTNPKENITCPAVVKEYNKHMGGVDVADIYIYIYFFLRYITL